MKKTHTLLLALFLCLALIFPCALAEDAYVPGQRTQALIDAALDAGQVVGGETRLTLQLGDEILSMLARIPRPPATTSLSPPRRT